MNGLLKLILSLSLSGSLLILVLFLCGPLFRDRISRRWQYYIWLVAIARLLLPFTPAVSPVGSLFQMFEQVTAEKSEASPSIPEDTMFPAGFMDSGEDDFFNVNSGDTEPSTGTSPLPQAAGSSAMQNLCFAWLAVALVLLVRKITIYQSFVRYIRSGSTEVSDTELLDRLSQTGLRAGVHRPVELYENSLISSPLLLGFFRPCIVLPSTSLPDSDFQYTILHEMTHYKMKDMFYKWLVQFAVCLHWFNPLVHLMSRRIARDCELACDEAVIANLGPENRRAYGDTLINAIGAGGNYRDSLASVTLNESRELLKERLEAIMKFKKPSKLAAAAATVCTILFCTGAAAAGAYGAVAPEPSAPQGKGFLYSQSGYYEAPFIFEMGWNLNEKGYDSYADKMEFTLSDQTKLTVSFDGSCKAFLQDEAAMSSLKTLLEKLKTERAGTKLPLKLPLVIGIKNVHGNSLPELAEKYYTERSLVDLIAIFPHLDNSAQNALTDRMFEEDALAPFAAVLGEDMDTERINAYAEQAYTEGKLTFFAVAAPYLTEDARQSWAERCSREKRNTYLAVLDVPAERLEIPVSIDRLGSGEEICIAEIPDIRHASKITYRLKRKDGGSLYVGIRSGKTETRGKRWYNYTGSGRGVIDWVSSDNIRYADDYSGNYFVYVECQVGAITDVEGTVIIEYDR